MDDHRTPSKTTALAAASLGLATLAGFACAQSEPPHSTSAGHEIDRVTSDRSLSTAFEAEASLDLGLRVNIGGESEGTDPLPLLSAAIEPISFRVLRQADAIDRGGLIRGGVSSGTGEEDNLRLSPTVSMSVGRHSALLDGGIAAERGVQADPLRGFAGIDGDFDLYDLSFRWAALAPGPIELGLLGGVRAIQSVGGMWRTEAQPAGPAGRPGFTETYDEDRSTVTLPVVGGDVRFHLADGITLSTSATTHSSGSSEAFFDMIMETSFDLGDGIGFHAGYQEVRSVFDDSGLAEPISQSGLFARLTIQF